MTGSARERSLPLVCGDPREGPASFSRFVLPFRYSLREICGPAAGPPGNSWPFYRLLSCSDLDPGSHRRHYLTRDTASVLFSRAAWFELMRPGPQGGAIEFSARRRAGGDGTYRVRVLPPRLVLFEYPGRDGSIAPSGEPDVLGTGFLLVDLTFPDPSAGPTLEDLQELNEVFRIWRRPFDGHDRERGYREILGDCPLDLTLGAPAGTPGFRVADASADGDPGRGEPDAYLDRWIPLLDVPLQAPVRRRKERAFLLFPGGADGWHDRVRAWCRDPLVPDPGWAVYSDSRAFVWTCALVYDGAGAFHSGESGDEGSAGEPWEDRRWIELLNVDPPGYAGEEPGRFLRDVARERTYVRWAHLGTLYGFTVHSGAMLASPVESPALHRHFAESYFDQTLLLLYLRITSLRFSETLTSLTAKLRGEGGRRPDRGGWEEDFASLREDFAVFTNLYEFPRVSNQEQGIEMYTLARKVLDVEEFFDELEDEIRSAHEYLAMAVSSRQSAEMTRLTWIATLGLPAAVITGFFGMNIVVEPLFDASSLRFQVIVVASVLSLGLALVYLLTKLLLGRGPKSKARRRRR